MRKPLAGQLQISRPSSSRREDHFISIEITDGESRTRFLELEISAEGLMLALTGLSCIPCLFEVRADRVGYKAEHKIEVLEVPEFGYGQSRDANAAKFLAEHPLSTDDLTNQHRSAGKNRQRVTFRRHVHPETGEPFKAK